MIGSLDLSVKGEISVFIAYSSTDVSDLLWKLFHKLLSISVCNSPALYSSACISANPQRMVLLQNSVLLVSALVTVLDLWVFEQPERVKAFINGQNFENLALKVGNCWIQDFKQIGL